MSKLDERTLALALHEVEEEAGTAFEINCFSCAVPQYSDNFQPGPNDACWQIAHSILAKLKGVLIS